MSGLLFTLVTLAALAHAEETCLSAEEEPYLRFGDKTSYNFVTRGSPDGRANEVLGCTPVAFWLVNRHGSHNPEAAEIPELQRLMDLKENIRTNYKNGNFRNNNHQICLADLNTLESWKYNPRQSPEFSGQLTSNGYMTAQQIAQGWRQMYPTLLGNNRNDYSIKYANDSCSITSCQAFMEGLFGAQAEAVGIPKQVNDTLLRPYKYCPAWIKDVEENNDTLTQKNIFESKQEYKEMITNISLRLGFNYDIDRATVLSMYQMCRYNKAWDNINISPWCAAFTREDLLRLEYAEDLETYYKYGHGSSATEKVGCTLIKDMVDFFRLQIDETVLPKPLLKIHFTDAPMLLMTHTLLGGHRSLTPLTGDNFRTPPTQNRKWTTSTMAPYNGNLGAVLYKCTTNYLNQDKYQILFLENQQQMNIEGCRVGLCSWTHVLNKYANIADNCDLKYCSSATRNGFVGIILFASIVLRYFV